MICFLLCGGHGKSLGQQEAPDELTRFFGPAEIADERLAERVADLWKTLMVGAARERLAARLELVELGAAAHPRLLAELESETADARRQALFTLGRSGDAAVAAHLRRWLDRRGAKLDEPTLQALLLALGRLGGPDDVPEIARRLIDTRNRRTRRTAVYALGRLASGGDDLDLARFWDREKSREFRAALLLVLGRTDGEDAGRQLVASARAGKEGLRLPAVLALAGRPDVALEPRLLRELLADGDEEVRRAALLRLALVPGAGATALIEASGALRSDDPETRATAALALGAQGDARALELLLERASARGERDTRARSALAGALGRIPDPAARARVVEMIADADPAVARSALWAARLQGEALDLGALLTDARRRDVAVLALDLMAFDDPGAARERAVALAKDAGVPEELALRARELTVRLARPVATTRAELRLRLQLAIDDLGLSPSWRRVLAIHGEMLRIEEIERSLDARPTARVGPDGSVRIVGRWSKEDEDLRLWWDTFPYFETQRVWDVPE